MTLRRKKTNSSSVIKVRVLLWMGLKNLLNKKLRTGLTMIGIVIGLGAIVFVLSLAIGLHKVVNDEVIGSKSIKTIDVTSPNPSAIELNTANLQKIKQTDNVVEVATAYVLPGQITYQGSLSDTVVYGYDNNYLHLSGLKVVSGTQAISNESSALVNTSMLSLIGLSSARAALGHSLSVQVGLLSSQGTISRYISTEVKIVGVVSTGSGAEVYINQNILNKYNLPYYSQFKVVSNQTSNVASIRSRIASLGLTTASPLDTLNEINTVFKFFTLIVIGFGGIGIIIAVLGMINTLTISLLERTSEIGLMNALGARRADIQRMLISEALLLSVIGGVGGIVLASIVGGGIDIVLGHLASGRGIQTDVAIFDITLLLIASVVTVAALIGLGVAFYPAQRASKINPIDALRHE